MNKKNLSLLLLFFILIIGAYFLFFLLPIFRDAKLLKTHYVTAVVKNDHVDYKLVTKRPFNWISPKQNPLATKAIMISEDWAFYNHEGVDLNQIKETVMGNLRQKKRIRGASTITQQLVKNLFLSKEKTLTRKFNEIIIALYLESVVSKQKILETYLNVIEYGKNLYGINKAAYFYFQKSFSELNPKEAAFLAMLLPNPKKYSSSYFRKELTPYAKKIIKNILTKLTTVRAIDQDQRDFYLLQEFDWEITQPAINPSEQVVEEELTAEERAFLDQLD